MNIMFAVDQMRTGGAERVAANLCNAFVSLGHSTSIVMLNETGERSHYAVDNKVRLIPVKKTYRGNNPVKKVRLLRQVFSAELPDVVISFLHNVNVYTHFALTGLKIPHIVSERNDPVKYPESKLMRLLRDHVFKKADGRVFQTADAQSYFSSAVRTGSVIIPNPVVLMYEPVGPVEREKKITAAGRLAVQKNYGMMLRAFATFSEKYPGYKLVICGDGNLKPDIERLIRELNLEDAVTLMGQVENPHEIIYDAAIFALSSDHEGMPNALLEAMALGVPSVSTDCPCGGPAELIRDGENGLLVPVGDAAAMADAFARVAGDTEFADKLSANAAHLKDTYSVGSIAQRWIEYIGGIANRKIKPPTGGTYE